MKNQTAINIKIKFGTEVVTLKNVNDRKTTREGVQLYIQERQADIRAWASIPDGTLEQYKHTKPVILSCDWIQKQGEPS